MRHAALLALTLVPMLAHAQARDSVTIPFVATSATRTGRIAPDKVSFVAVVEAFGETVADATQRVDRKMQAVNDALKSLGGRVETVTMQSYGVMPNSQPGFPGQGTSNLYVARYVLRFQSTRVDQLMTFTTALIPAGVTNIGQPAFETSKTDSVRRVKYAEAAAQARSDAEALAAAMGMRLGQLESITTNSFPTAPVPVPSNMVNFTRGEQMMVSGAAPMPEVAVTVTVNVRYRIVR